jgi:class 3 adenylate cyclase/TolB-like protein
MPEATHQLAAIMFTDIVGYTAAMGKDEQRAMELLKVNRKIQKPLIEVHNGTWLKEMGDGILASFSSVSDAVYCAGAIQKVCENEHDIELRIGIHLGEVVFEGDDVFGDGVNIASRIEALASVGSIWISEPVERNIQNKKGIQTRFIREETLKNVKDPVRIYEVKFEGIEVPESQATTEESIGSRVSDKPKSSKLKSVGFISLLIIITLSLFYFLYFKKDNETALTQPLDSGVEDISIAVLPFKNYSGDPELEPFCDAMTDAVISRLTKLEGIGKVISMTSVMSYKQTLKTSPEIAAELRVTHILEANFQKSGDQVKINLQLIDGPSDDHYWSSEYNGEWGIGIFQIQAEVAENVALNMGAQITEAEIESIQLIPTNNEDAYNLYIQAEFQRNKSNERAFEYAIPLYEKAIELDSSFAEAYLGLASIWATGGLVWGIYNEREAWQNAKKFLQKALANDSTNTALNNELYGGYFWYDWDFELTEQYYHSGNIVNVDYLVKTGRYDEAMEQVNKDILEDPSDGVNYAFKAESLMFLDKKNEAIQLLRTNDPLYIDDWFYLRETAKHYYYLGEYEKSKSHLNIMISNFPDSYPPILIWLNAVYHQMDGNDKEVKKYLGELNEKYQNNASGSPAWFTSLYYCHIKDYEMAFEWLQKSYERHEVEMTWLREEPLLIPIRDDPRYKELYQKVGFPERI